MIHTERHNKTWKEHNKTWKGGEEKSINPKFYKQQMHLLKINHHFFPKHKKNEGISVAAYTCSHPGSWNSSVNDCTLGGLPRLRKPRSLGTAIPRRLHGMTGQAFPKDRLN